jgi:hypothetical protein
MNDVLTRAACDFEDDTRHRQYIAKDIENEIAIPYCRRRVLAVIGHLLRTFNSALAPLTRRAFVAEVSRNSVRRVYGTASLSEPRDLSRCDDNANPDRLGLALQ